LEPESSGRVDIDPAFQTRVAAPEGAHHHLQLARIEAPAVAGLIGQGQVLRSGKALSPNGQLLDAAPPRGPPPAIAAVQRGEFASAARQLVTQPQQFREAYNSYFEAQLARIDRALTEGRPDVALASIDRLSSQFGTRPSLRLRRGLAFLDQYRIHETVETASGGAGHGSGVIRRFDGGSGGDSWRQDRGVLGFFNEVNRRIEDPQIPPQQRDSTRSLAEYAHFQLRRAHGTDTPGEAALQVVGDSLQLRIALPRDMKGKKLDSAELAALAADPSRRKSGVFYVQDSPSLAHLDWSPSPVRALREIASGAVLADVFRLPAGDVGRYNPAEIYAPAVTEQPLRRVESGGQVSSVWSLGGRIRPPESASSPNECPNPEPGCQEADAPETYLVIPRPAA
jgi:hypothetical protein